jgi:CheY-like chemotaxis protein
MLPKKILLAEDDVDDREFFHNFLESRKDVVLVFEAENGEHVFEVLKNITEDSMLPDLILLDQNMPKRNGLETLQLLKDHTVYKNIPVFIYSTYSNEALHQQSVAAGAISVFPKPFTHQGYDKMVNDMLALAG